MLHKSDFNGREINVEFTAPGRKNANLTQKLQEKNKRLAKYKLSRDTILDQSGGFQQGGGYRSQGGAHRGRGGRRPPGGRGGRPPGGNFRNNTS